jgi:membrane protein YqaA with SNARE-associated domain
MRIFRRLYDWVLHWANTPYGAPALFLLALAESSVFPVPPDVLLIALSISLPHRAWYYATICSLGSVIGGVIGYLLGWGFWSLLADFFFTYVPGFTPQLFARVQALYAEHDFWVVFAAGFTPIPYKVITIAAGVFLINFPVFVLASIIGRSARFFLVAGLIRRYGPGIRSFVDRYFNLLSLLFLILLIGGFLVLKYAF